VSLSTLHAGALLGSDSNLKVEVTKLQKLIRSSHQYSTNEEGRINEIKHEFGKVDVRNADCFVLNGTSASAADGFCGLIINGENGVRELHQNKHIKNDVSKSLFKKEYEKAAMEKDVFILFTTHESEITAADLPARGGIVSKKNFQDYFGPFSARAFSEFKITINQASRSQLQATAGIGPARAEKILNERKKGNFKNRSDFVNRTGITRQLSQAFIF